MKNEVNHRNLLLARESRGITQKTMAEAIEGLNQGNLSKMEKGVLPISEEMIGRVAKYLDYPVSFFYKESQSRKLNSFFYRKRVTMPNRELTMLEARFDTARIAIDELLDSVEIPEFDLPSISTFSGITPKEVARRTRLFLGIQKGPIENFVKTIERHGIIVVFLEDAPEKFFGVTMFTNKAVPVIFINGDKSGDNKRFTLGHELGHLVMHLREDVYSLDEKDMDKEADAFSSEFNMPEQECRGDLLNVKYKDLPTIKMYWKLSKAAICYKAKEMGMLGDSQYRYYMMQLSKSGQRKKETEYIDIDDPSLLRKIVKVHLEDLEYSKKELETLTGLSDNDLETILPQTQLVRPKIRILRNWD
jgi:Zn-dependent peptidase ImmA (M78 family)